ncbi:hypothetical protein ACHHV8_22555 [Paenibacillus sp. TAB 01]|uniref:hypothetical protein n=1 Tax=Paenibacillus sp. TAB 01 TaxID=3368988 RepID=UPI00375250D5
MKNKQMIGLVLSASLVTMGLVGCGSNQTADNAAGSGTTPGKVVKLKFWGAVPEESGPKKQ